MEGKNLVIEYRAAEGKLDRLPALLAELVRLKADVIVTAGPPGTRAAKEAAVTIPIVMGFDNDPVGNGFVASLARPGGNITGLATLAPELSGKQLDRSCPRCNGYVGIVLPGPGQNTPLQAVNGKCLRCSYHLAWIVIRGKRDSVRGLERKLRLSKRK